MFRLSKCSRVINLFFFFFFFFEKFSDELLKKNEKVIGIEADIALLSSFF